jgi:hypothetical protein
MFQRYTSLDNHIQYGKCHLKEEKVSLFDKAKEIYRDKLLRGQGPQPVLTAMLTAGAPTSPETDSRGWALKTSKRACVSQKNKGSI